MFRNELQYKLKIAHEITKAKLIEQKIKRQKEHDETVNPIYIKLKDLVFLKNENRRKLDSFYIGPYEVISICEPNCEIKNTTTGKTIVVHKNRLIKN